MGDATSSLLSRRLAAYTGRVADRAARQRLTPADLRNLRLPWYEIVNQTDDNDSATVYIYDEIGGSFGVNAQKFAEDLNAITAPQIAVRINSPGGALFDGIAIHNTIAAHPARVTVHVDSLAASIASVIAMAGDEVVMQPGSQMMIHDALAVTLGNSAEHRAMASFLDRQSDNIAGIYQGRAGGEVAEWRERMLAETWMFAGEAVELGLADRVARRDDDDPPGAGDQDEPPAAPDQDLEALMARAHSLARFRFGGRAEAPPPLSAVTRTVNFDALAQAMKGALR